MARWRKDPVISYGLPLAGGLLGAMTLGDTWYVDGAVGSDMSGGRNSKKPLKTIQRAIDRASPGDVILVAPGTYEESVEILAGKNGITIVGMGGRGACCIETPDENGTGLLVRADDVTVINIGAAGDGTGKGIEVTGDRFRAVASKFEGGAVACEMLGGIDDDDLEGSAADALFDDCEFAWSTMGLKLSQGFIGAVTQSRFRRCRFHNLTTHVGDGAGAADGKFRNLVIDECVFETDEDGSLPTAFLDLDADNGNTGMVTGCAFATPSNTNVAGKLLVGTGVIFVANKTVAGISTAQPVDDS